MFRAIFDRLHRLERRAKAAFGKDISTPRGRRAAKWHYYLSDVGFLRVFWTNLDQIAPDVWRSNQPDPRRLRRMQAMGVRTVLNLRGVRDESYYLFEKEACDQLGLTLIDHNIHARRLAPREMMTGIFEIFDRAEKPLLIHCKSGADRAGLVSALWLLDQEGASIEQARAMLSLRYAHLKSTATGIMDHVLDSYDEDNAETPMPVRDWFATRYDPQRLTDSFRARGGRAKDPAPGKAAS